MWFSLEIREELGTYELIWRATVVAAALDIFSSLLFNLNIKRIWILYYFLEHVDNLFGQTKGYSVIDLWYILRGICGKGKQNNIWFLFIRFKTAHSFSRSATFCSLHYCITTYGSEFEWPKVTVVKVALFNSFIKAK